MYTSPSAATVLLSHIQVCLIFGQQKRRSVCRETPRKKEKNMHNVQLWTVYWCTFSRLDFIQNSLARWGDLKAHFYFIKSYDIKFLETEVHVNYRQKFNLHTTEHTVPVLLTDQPFSVV